MQQVIVYGHRGASCELPENTLQSFGRAFERGAHALESDVHMTRDGHIVCSHDADGMRMAGVDQQIRASSLEEVQRWDVGWGFVDDEGRRPFAGQGYRIPTLVEVLEAFEDKRLNLDIKQTEPNMVAPLLHLLRTREAEDRVQLASFWRENLEEVLAAGYAGEVGLSRAELIGLFFGPGFALRRVRRLGQHGRSRRRAQVPTHAGPLDLSSPRFLDKCGELGIAVDYWTINDAAEARRLASLGAAGIITDDPAAICGALAP